MSCVKLSWVSVGVVYFTHRSRRNKVQQCSNLNSDQLSVEVRCDMNYEFGILIGAEVDPGI